MGVVWGKIRRDLGQNKGRTVLVVLSIAVGVFALGLIYGAHNLMKARLTEDYRASRPAHVRLWGRVLDQEIIETVSHEPGVAEVESQVESTLRWRLEGETEWRDAQLLARPDYEAQRVSLIDLLDGAWPSKRALAVERQSSRHFGLPVGSAIVVEHGRREIRLPIVGLVRDPQVQPPVFGGNAQFYATPEAVLWLTGAESGRMDILMAEYSRDGARELAESLWDRLQAMGADFNGWGTNDPHKHMAQDVVDTVFTILIVLGTLALGMSVFLIVNTMNAIVAQQVWQIGVMKVVGATVGRVVRVYLTTALLYGSLAVLLAVPASAAGSYFLASWILDMLNVTAGPFRVMPAVLGLQLLVGLAVPLLAALVPVLGGACISARRAISTYGLGGGFGQGLFDRLVARLRSFPRPVALSVRNTFRRKARVALTLVTLTLGGAAFMMVMSVRASFDRTLDVLAQDLGYDVLMYFERSYLISQIVSVAESVPGVTEAEVWFGHVSTNLKFKEGDEIGSHFGMYGIPPDSQIARPRIISGRGLLPGDGRAILLNNTVAVEEGIRVGDQVRFSLGGDDMTWTVVGVILNLGYGQRECFVPYDTLAREFGVSIRGWEVTVSAAQHDPASQAALLDALRQVYGAHDMQVGYSQTGHDVQEDSRSVFEIIAILLLVMSVLAAVVGGIGLMGTMSINVLERRREIGMLRATGATSPVVAGIFIFEGVLIGLLSWVLAAPLSYPAARLFGRVIGDTLLSADLYFRYSVAGTLAWLVIVVVVAVLASLWPALQATRVSVREALAYE